MVDIEEIEEKYKKNLEAIEKEYVDGIKTNSNSKELDKFYKEKVKEARDVYYKELGNFIEKSKSVKKKRRKRSSRRS